MEKYIKKLSSLLSTSKDIIVRSGLESEFQELQSALAQIQSQATTILVCGEFKRGKSSFINALLGEDICPVDIGVTTAAVSVIRYGKTPKVTRYHGNIVEDGETADLKTETVEYASIQDYVKGSSIDIANTIMLDIEVPNERLKSGLCVIDTPGVGSMDPRHLFLTLYALPKADAIFFMTAAGEPMTATERDFYAHHIAPLNKPSRVLLNKADRFSTDAERDIVITDTVKKFTEVNIADITVLPISAEQWIEYNKSGDDFAKEISNMDAVLTVMEDIRKEQEYGLIKNVASQFVELINKAGNSVQERLHSLQSNELNEEQKKLKKNIEELSDLQKQLADESSPLRKKINETVKQTQQTVFSEFTKGNILLTTEKLDQILESDEVYKDNGDKYVIDKINENISVIAKNADAIILNAKQKIELELRQELKTLGKISNTGINEKKLNVKVSKDVFSLYRQGGIGLGLCYAGARAGMLLAPEILAPVGLIAGIGVAAYHAFRGIRGARRREQALALKRIAAPKISIAMEETKQAIQKQLENFQSNIIETLKEEVKAISKQIAETKKLLAASKGDDKVRQENIIKTQKDLTFIIYVANELKNLPLK